MIAIYNRGKAFARIEHVYELFINKELIVGFTHVREEGLAICLRKAADAVEKELEKRKMAS